MISQTRARVFYLLTLLVFVSATSGCGQWDAYALGALTLRDTSNEAKSFLRELRREHMREAARAAQTSGGDIGAAIDNAAHEWDRGHADVTDAQAAFAMASNGFTSATFTAMQGRGTAEIVVTAGRAAIETYNRLVGIFRRRGFPDLSEIPPGLAQLLGIFVPSSESEGAGQ